MSDPIKMDTIARRLDEVAAALREYVGCIERGAVLDSVVICLQGDANYLRNIAEALRKELQNPS